MARFADAFDRPTPPDGSAAPAERTHHVVLRSPTPAALPLSLSSLPLFDDTPHLRPDARQDSFPSIPGYRFVRELGRGGMGVVYEALDAGLNRLVALKLMTDAAAADPANFARAVGEAEAVARLRHPNVVQIYQVGNDRGRPFMALELVRGGSLKDWLAHGPLAVGRAVDVARAVARGVQHAHDRGVIHRDLKPANILVEWDAPRVRIGDAVTVAAGPPEDVPGQPPVPVVPKVTDFGIAKLLDDDTGRTRTGMFMGTLLYIAPEVIDHPRAASPASDVYSLGVILYECLTGRHPLVGESFLDTVRLVQEVEPEPPGRVRPGLPKALDAVCRRALAKSPAERYRTAAELADDLDRVASGRRVRRRAARASGGFGRFVPWRGMAVAAVVVSLGGLHAGERYGDAVAAARTGAEQLARGGYADAEASAARGLRRVGALPGCDGLTADLTALHRAARRGRLAADLHRVVDRLRFGYDTDVLAGDSLRTLTATCDDLWAAREQFTPAGGYDLGPAREADLRTDLLDLALLSADLRVREGSGSDEARRDAAARLGEAEQSPGAATVLPAIRESVLAGSELSPPGPGSGARDLYALGRFLLNRGDADGAAPLLRRAVDLEPTAFWPNFHLAMAAHRRGRHDDAVAGFSACLALAHDRRGLCHYNRAVAYEALGSLEAAARDLDRALDLEPGLAVARFRRGVVRIRLKQYAGAAADLEWALRDGFSPAAAWYHLALVRRAAGDHTGALAAATEAVALAPQSNKSRALLNDLNPGRLPRRP